MDAQDSPVLSASNVDLHYGSVHILQGISVDIGALPRAIIGPNGMGKTSLCRAIMGLLPLSGGNIKLKGVVIDHQAPDWRARHGMAYVPQGRRVFPTLTVDEHLRIMHRGKNQQWTRERIYDIFPRLAERRSNFGNRLSGGEQQMLAIGRALMIDPCLLILDEPTEGLAPVVVDHVVEILQQLSTEGIAILLVEQNLSVAAELAEEISIMVNGKIIDHIPSSQLLHDETMQRKYLGISLDGY